MIFTVDRNESKRADTRVKKCCFSLDFIVLETEHVWTAEKNNCKTLPVKETVNKVCLFKKTASRLIDTKHNNLLQLCTIVVVLYRILYTLTISKYIRI